MTPDEQLDRYVDFLIDVIESEETMEDSQILTDTSRLGSIGVQTQE